MTEEQVFLAVLDLPDRTNRTAYLDEACGDNGALRRQVEELLAAHERSGQFLDEPAAEQIAAGQDQTVALHTEGADAMADNKKTSPAPSDDDADDLQFLSPSTRPDSFGRLGHYEMLQVLGHGGFGIVFRAFDDMLQRVVAVKVMAPQLAATSPARRRFLREAQSSAKVRHENVVQVYEVGEQPLPYLVMEFVPGETLQQKLDRCGPLDVPETLRIGRQIAEGLAAAHACDLIHRDIKPGNILLEGEPGCVSAGSSRVKITDFGLARAADDASISQSGIIAGTPMFMAPEQALGHTIDQRADLFSLGSVLYQMASGRPPFRAPSALAVLKRVAEEPPRPIPEIIPETPTWLCGIIAKLHAKDPADRFQSAREVADLLERQLAAPQRSASYYGPGGVDFLTPKSTLQLIAARLQFVVEVLMILAAIQLLWSLGCLFVGIVDFVEGEQESRYLVWGCIDLFFGAVTMTAGILLYLSRMRLVTLMLLVVFDVFLTACLGVFALLEEGLDEAVFLIPTWLSLPVAIWTSWLLCQPKVRHHFDRRSVDFVRARSKRTRAEQHQASKYIDESNTLS